MFIINLAAINLLLVYYVNLWSQCWTSTAVSSVKVLWLFDPSCLHSHMPKADFLFLSSSSVAPPVYIGVSIKLGMSHTDPKGCLSVYVSEAKDHWTNNGIGWVGSQSGLNLWRGCDDYKKVSYFLVISTFCSRWITSILSKATTCLCSVNLSLEGQQVSEAREASQQQGSWHTNSGHRTQWTHSKKIQATPILLNCIIRVIQLQT